MCAGKRESKVLSDPQSLRAVGSGQNERKDIILLFFSEYVQQQALDLRVCTHEAKTVALRETMGREVGQPTAGHRFNGTKRRSNRVR